AEHSFLLVIVSAHSLVSLTFFTSDEFFQLKLHKEWVFQQAAKGWAYSMNLMRKAVGPFLLAYVLAIGGPACIPAAAQQITGTIRGTVTDVALQGQAPEISGFSAQRPNIVGNPFTPGAVAANPGCVAPTQTRTVAAWFNPCAFAEAATGAFGDEGRNAIQGPGYANWDFALLKDIPLTERDRLQFRAELFNILNHTNLRLPVLDIQSPNVGAIQRDVGPRVIQLALKFLF
ncbi:MAG: hypothetical protein ACRD8A_11335, partial [Candidatus Acidiferrales bacterium]